MARRNGMKRLVCFILTLVFALEYRSLQGAVVNGGFESPAVTGEQYVIPDGWTSSNSPRTAIDNDAWFTSYDGQSLELSMAELWQNTGIALNPGDTVTVSVYTSQQSEYSQGRINLYGAVTANSSDKGTLLGSKNVSYSPPSTWSKQTYSYGVQAACYLVVAVEEYSTIYAWTEFDDVQVSVIPAQAGVKNGSFEAPAVSSVQPVLPDGWNATSSRTWIDPSVAVQGQPDGTQALVVSQNEFWQNTCICVNPGQQVTISLYFDEVNPNLKSYLNIYGASTAGSADKGTLINRYQLPASYGQWSQNTYTYISTESSPFYLVIGLQEDSGTYGWTEFDNVTARVDTPTNKTLLNETFDGIPNQNITSRGWTKDCGTDDMVLTTDWPFDNMGMLAVVNFSEFDEWLIYSKTFSSYTLGNDEAMVATMTLRNGMTPWDKFVLIGDAEYTLERSIGGEYYHCYDSNGHERPSTWFPGSSWLNAQTDYKIIATKTYTKMFWKLHTDSVWTLLWACPTGTNTVSGVRFGGKCGVGDYAYLRFDSIKVEVTSDPYVIPSSINETFDAMPGTDLSWLGWTKDSGSGDMVVRNDWPLDSAMGALAMIDVPTGGWISYRKNIIPHTLADNEAVIATMSTRSGVLTYDRLSLFGNIEHRIERSLAGETYICWDSTAANSQSRYINRVQWMDQPIDYKIVADKSGAKYFWKLHSDSEWTHLWTSSNGITSVTGVGFAGALSDGGASCYMQFDSIGLNIVQAQVSEPSFTPLYISGSTQVTISSKLEGVSIYYALNGDPTTGGTLYEDPVTVNVGDTLNAIATKSGYTDSLVSSRTFNYPPAPAPVFSPGSPYISGPTAIAVNNVIPGASIYYTLDGSVPTTASTLYSGPVTVNVGDTLKAIAMSSTYSLSNVTSVKYIDSSVNSVSIYDGIPHVNQNPFLVIGIYHSGDAIIDIINSETPGALTRNGLFQDLADRKFNTVFYTGGVAPHEFYQAADGYGLKVVSQSGCSFSAVADVMDEPNVFGWYGYDEPTADVAEACVDLFETYKSLDPYHPVMTAFHTDDYSGYGTERLVDIAMPDPYPFTHSTSSISPLVPGYINGCLNDLLRNDPTSCVIYVPQLFTSDGWGAYAPTYDQIRADVYTAMHYGAKGFFYYAFYTHEPLSAGMPLNSSRTHWYLPESPLWNQIGTLNQELISLTDVILLGKLQSTVSFDNTGSVLGRCMISPNGDRYVLLVNPTAGSQSNIQISGLFNVQLQPQFSSPTATLSSSQWTVSLSGYGVGVYFTPRILGDANSDGAVDVGDLGILAANYGGSGKTWGQGDFNGDKVVDVGDLGILAAHYGTNASAANWSADYSKAFGTTIDENTDDVESTATSICSGLGLPLIVGLALMGLMLIKLEE
jgi:hypothetical protein